MEVNQQKILTVIGARPQFIKAAAVSRAIANNQGMLEVCVHTGQHYDTNMSEIFFEELEIPKPAYNLGVSGGNHGAQTGQMLEGIEKVILKEKPQAVLVYGDTNSTLAGALAAAKLQIPIAHVEAGLRSFNRSMPEEINRILTDHCSELLFAPTDTAHQRLITEGIPSDKIMLSGDVMFDSTLFYSAKAKRESTIIEELGLKNKQYTLVTIHRASNTDDPAQLRKILEALNTLSSSCEMVLPLHPRTRNAITKHGFEALLESLKCIEPVGYLDMLQLERHSRVVITDSGGVQKEAFFQKVPCITLRNETEWKELVAGGWNTLSTPDSLYEDFEHSTKVQFIGAPALYGAGNAATMIVNKIQEFLNQQVPLKPTII